MMRRLVLGILFFIGAVSGAAAKVYWLPDYLQENTDRNSNDYHCRVNENNGYCDNGGNTGGGSDHRPQSSCRTYGWIDAADKGNMECAGYEVLPGGVTCYKNCACPNKYQYTAANCSGDKAPSGAACGGKFDTCSCNSSLFPYTSCPDGHLLGGNTCSDGTTHYSECIDPCAGLSDNDCGQFDCKQTYSQCTTKCEVCYTDNCHIREDAEHPFGCETFWDDCAEKCQTPAPDPCLSRPDNTSDYGCDKYWQDCPAKCELGKTCTPTDCSEFELTTVPANASYETCKPGCGSTATYYRITQCNIGYWDLNKFLCNGSQLCTWRTN